MQTILAPSPGVWRRYKKRRNFRPTTLRLLDEVTQKKGYVNSCNISYSLPEDLNLNAVFWFKIRVATFHNPFSRFRMIQRPPTAPTPPCTLCQFAMVGEPTGVSSWRWTAQLPPLSTRLHITSLAFTLGFARAVLLYLLFSVLGHQRGGWVRFLVGG